MAYIAMKATYIGEEEVKNEHGNPVKRIKTDVDDVHPTALTHTAMAHELGVKISWYN